MKKLMILLAVLMIISVSYGENGPSPLVTPGSVSGIGTIATVDSPVPVANGGTGATTAAAGLAALGGASLNGSSTVAFAAKTLKVTSPDSPHGADFDGLSNNDFRLRLFSDATGRTANDGAMFAQIGLDSYVYNYEAGTLNFGTSGAVRAFIRANGVVNFSVVSVYADNAAALTGGLLAGDIYKTATGQLMIVY